MVRRSRGGGMGVERLGGGKGEYGSGKVGGGGGGGCLEPSSK